ncbi:hypothetical protein [Pseudomonas muyukensis]|uniref:Uncharacterized protein n=1 Tax=Pseudomonas muyukensis TaxID=2842357 RepID=A0ABX8M2E7_9PSED|nr:hypothetical protein [Pseudomonas muyukensis]QXH33293.1 hypothetical protein KSS95_14000 [Pseudomonas muyukensis]
MSTKTTAFVWFEIPGSHCDPLAIQGRLRKTALSCAAGEIFIGEKGDDSRMT